MVEECDLTASLTTLIFSYFSFFLFWVVRGRLSWLTASFRVHSPIYR